jgi:hypothetical protein
MLYSFCGGYYIVSVLTAPAHVGVGLCSKCTSPGKRWGLWTIGSQSISSTALSSFVVMGHRYDDIALFVSFVEVPVSVDDLLHWIASVYDRFDFARLDEPFEEIWSFRITS